MEVLENVLFYNAKEFPSVRIETKKLEQVSLLLGIDVCQEMMGSSYLKVLSERIELLEHLKTQAIDYLKNNRKKSKNKNDLYLVNQYVMFLDKILHMNYQVLIRENRVKRRKSIVDVNSIFQVSENAKEISKQMVNGEDILVLDIEDSTKDVIMGLAYLLKKHSFSEVDNLPKEMIFKYVDDVYSYLLDSPLIYQRYFEPIRLLYDVVRYRKLSLRDEISNSKEKDEINAFLSKIIKKIERLEEYQIKYEEAVIDPEIEEEKKYYQKFIDLVKNSRNINEVRKSLDADEDLLYLVSPTYDNKYFFVEIFDEYGNMVVNAKTNNEKFGYYHQVIECYIEEILKQEDENLKVLLYKKLSRLFTTMENCSFEADRKDLSYKIVNGLLEKLQGFKEQDPYQVINNLNHYDLIRRDSDDNYIFTVSDSKDYFFEQAFSYKKSDSVHEVGFYIIDVMKNRPTTNTSIQEMFWKIERGDAFFNRKAKEETSLVKDEDHYVVGYHFKIDEQYNIVDFNMEKEKIRVRQNLSFEEADLIIQNQKNFLHSDIQPFFSFMTNILFKNGNGISINDGSISQNIYDKSLFFLNQQLGKYAISNGYPLIGIMENSDKVELSEVESDLYFTDIKDIKEHGFGSYACPSSSIVDYINQIILCRYNDKNGNISYQDDWFLRASLRNIVSKLNQQHQDDVKAKQKRKCCPDYF